LSITMSGFWKKFKKTMRIGGGMAKDVAGLMSLVPGRVGEAARAAMPAATVVSGMSKHMR